MLTVTVPAQRHFGKLLVKQEENTAIRVYVSSAGTVDAYCGVCFCPPESFRYSDVVVKFGPITFRIEESVVPFLRDSIIDVVKDGLEVQLTFKAPYARKILEGNKDGGESGDDLSLKKRIEDVLEREINPQLYLHGGKVSLVKVTNDLVVVLEFSGGCNGCAMATRTMKLGIESTLKRIFPQVRSVCDVTEHRRGSHSYF